MSERFNVADIFGENVFNDTIMKERLPKNVYKNLKLTMEGVQELSLADADVIANAMKDWAIEKGATHYTHWFQPMTGVTAEKHDSFLSPASKSRPVLEFSGKELIKGEPDASSFPSGGIRATFEARGYTAWDCTSPAFLKEDAAGVTLCIPTAFCSYTGEALDKKTPLLRSMEAISKQAVRIMKLFGYDDVKKVSCSVGPEQEYFLIDKDKFNQRLDLKLTGRTLFGAPAPKGQELDDQYFGVIKDKVSHFMRELNKDLWEYGIPAKTQHNEVAPSQHEIAPIYGTTNVATDQNQLLMETLKKVAERNGFACLLHEKPFAGVNGSGKHNNWSISTSDGENLIDPGKEPEKNLQFQVFLAAILESVDNHAALLRLSASSAGNDHRLGANEAPPAIISAYLGDQLADVVDQIIANGEATSSLKGKVYKSGCSVIPEFKMDATDRNRTSPFAFTGNKFEFRMVGSTQCIAQPMMTLNTIVADTLCNFADVLEKADDFEAAAKKLVADKLREHQRIIFNGNGYSEEWVKEAERRGLPNIKCMVDAVDYLATPENIEMFEKHGVMSKRELVARGVVMYENYAKQINIEAKTMIEMSTKQIIPAVMKYEGTLAASVKDLKELGISADTQMEILSTIDTKLAELKKATAELEDIVAKAAEKEEDPKAWAKYYHDVVFAFFDTVRKPADELEKIVDAKTWPFPTYEELLFEQ